MFLNAVRKLLRDAHVLQHVPRRAAIARVLHDGTRDWPSLVALLDVRIDAPDRSGVLDLHRDRHVVRDRERAGDLERVGAAVAGAVAGHERLVVVALRKHRERPVAEVVRHADHRRHHADGGDLRLDARRQSGRPEEALLDAYVNVFESSL